MLYAIIWCLYIVKWVDVSDYGASMVSITITIYIMMMKMILMIMMIKTTVIDINSSGNDNSNNDVNDDYDHCSDIIDDDKW